MSHLSAFTPEEKDLLISVFFRTGRWLSHIDDKGGYASDVAEEKELLSRLGRLKHEIKDSGIIAEIGTEAARRSGDWQNWSTDGAQVLRDVRCAGELIRLRLLPADLDAFKTGLMQIATEVAKAYREDEKGPDNTAQAETIFAHVRKFFSGAKDRYVTKELNISQKEAEALEQLSNTLKNIQ
jgi:hypothetical protein